MLHFHFELQIQVEAKVRKYQRLTRQSNKLKTIKWYISYNNIFIYNYITFLCSFSFAKTLANNDVNVLLPTPPFPDNTNILYFTDDSRCFKTSKAISRKKYKILIKKVQKYQITLEIILHAWVRKLSYTRCTNRLVWTSLTCRYLAS